MKDPMPPRHHGTNAARRGYLLIEILIAGAIISVVLGTLIGILADTRRKASANANDVVAMHLVRAKADELLASPHVVVAANAFENVNPNLPGFRWKWQVAQSGLQSNSTPVLRTADTLHEIVVTIEYPSSTNTPSTRVYRRFKPKR